MPDEQTRQEDQRRALLAAYRLVRSDLESSINHREERGLSLGNLMQFMGYVTVKVEYLSHAE